VDGSLGSRTAAFFKRFDDTPDSGFFVIEEGELYKRIKSADSAGLQVMTHAIGDKAIHTLLNIYERVGKENGDRDRRFRIEHAQHIDPRDINRFASLHVIPSMQPYHAIDDGRWAEKVIGVERSKTTYAFKSLLDNKARLAFGSDWFVAPPIPLEGIYAAVTRRTLDDKNLDGWVPGQKISIAQALNAYTLNAAYASFEENLKGSIEVGKLADFVILDENIFEISPEKIRDVQVLKTVVGGQVVYSKETEKM
jgi:predicted amidohydrolase YtcJ